MNSPLRAIVLLALLSTLNPQLSTAFGAPRRFVQSNEPLPL
jgi:hypothetical protein